MFIACLVGCGGQAAQTPQNMPAWGDGFDDRAHREERANAAVNVQGIEGTLSSYDVRKAMEAQNDAFAACHEPRANALPVLAGSIEFGIEVFANGKVGRVDVRASDLGDRVLERCLVQVIQNAPFPRPHGGVANVTYTMVLEPAQPGAEPEAWTPDRLGRVREKRASSLRESCGLGGASITVTAYVNPNGRVVSAGVAAGGEGVSEAQFDCIADELRSWPMPKPKKRFAKVSFALDSSS